MVTNRIIFFDSHIFIFIHTYNYYHLFSSRSKHINTNVMLYIVDIFQDKNCYYFPDKSIMITQFFLWWTKSDTLMFTILDDVFPERSIRFNVIWINSFRFFFSFLIQTLRSILLWQKKRGWRCFFFLLIDFINFSLFYVIFQMIVPLWFLFCFWFTQNQTLNIVKVRH